ncbi:hypothetical protein TIFTF001_004776 [Ficus carica]|uniref:Uncharacterized protein n=1 Tax=Ficus carica TaxID=3494 RepID=A0AA87ZIL4_FICCA|nr:hypothetical protein TIFTF001_004776 [Ficus carica]
MKLQRNVAQPTGECGIAVMGMYPFKYGRKSSKPYWAYEVDAEMVAVACIIFCLQPEERSKSGASVLVYCKD